MTTTPPEPSDDAHAQNVVELIAASQHLQSVLEGIQSLARLADRWRERAEAAEKRQADALALVDEQKTLIDQLRSQREDLLEKNAKLSSVPVVDVKTDEAVKERDYWRGMAERWKDKHDEVFRLWQCAGHDREQADQDAEAMVAVAARVERVRADLAKETEAHLETKQMLRDVKTLAEECVAESARNRELLASARSVSDERIVEIANLKRRIEGLSDGRAFIEAMREAIRGEAVREARAHAKCWGSASLYAGDHAHVLAKICEDIARELEGGK